MICLFSICIYLFPIPMFNIYVFIKYFFCEIASFYNLISKWLQLSIFCIINMSYIYIQRPSTYTMHQLSQLINLINHSHTINNIMGTKTLNHKLFSWIISCIGLKLNNKLHTPMKLNY